MRITYDPTKFVELVVHIAEQLHDDCAGGATKLNKILFFVEFSHLRRHHQVISGCEFQKFPHGPVPRQMAAVRRQLIESGSAKLVKQNYYGYPQERLIPLRGADLELFTNQEMQTISDVLVKVADMTAAEVSNLSHQELGWRLTRDGEVIPYAAAFLGSRQIQTPTSARLSESVAQRYGFAVAG